MRPRQRFGGSPGSYLSENNHYGRSWSGGVKPIYEFIAKDGQAAPRSVKDRLKWRPLVLPTVAPRLVLSLRRKEPADPARILSGAAGAGKLVNISLFSRDEGHPPTLLVAQAGQKLRDLVAMSAEIYIYELIEAVAPVCQVRFRLWGSRVILFVDNKAACAALTKGTSRGTAVLALVYAMRAIASQYNITIWT